MLGVTMGCNGPAKENPSGGKAPGVGSVVQSDKERKSAPEVPTSDMDALVAGNSAFAFDLYRFLAGETEGNFFYSPYSISQALAMTYAGARGETETQMGNALHFTLAQEQLHPAFNGLDLALAQRGEGAQGKDGEGFRLHIVNAIWGQANYTFLPEFLDVLAENYGAGLRIVDFIEATEATRVMINDWVSEQTEGRIKDLIPQGALNTLTRLVLTNAIYFNAAWAKSFEETQTQDGAFTLLDGSEVTVPLMWQQTSLGYAEQAGLQVVELPYDGHELSMVILLPEIGQFEAYERSLDAAQVASLMQSLNYQEIALTLPKFKMESEFSLVKALSELGMPVAFGAAADFSGMDGTHELFISDVIHKSFVDVDEAGTEAAAATAVVMEAKMAASEPPLEVRVDHPFLFLIRDMQTGAILFVGRVVNP
ncbi:MAG: serpin family protein [Anaerolineae bacterium]|nr:serpin family protein [Anaerolineae bacterium]